jgi:hypothetical protein
MRNAIARLPLVGSALIDLARGLRYPEVERLVRADLAKTQDEVAWLRLAMREPAPDARRLLVISLSDMVYQLKLEGMLAAALKLKGWRPIVLTNAPANTRAQRYHRAFGIDEFVYLADFATTAAERAMAAAEAARLTAGQLTFQAVKQWSFANSWIGPQILSTVSRTHHEGAPDPAHPETRAEITMMLPELLARALVAQRVLDRVRPDLGLVNEANYALNGPFVDQMTAGGLGVIQFFQPWRDDALSFRRLTKATRRVHPSAIAPERFAVLAQQPWTAAADRAVDQIFADRYSGKWFLQTRNQPGTRRTDRIAIQTKLGLDPAKKTAIVFSHVLWDANLFFGEDLFQDYGEWFVETLRAAAANPHLNWVIKLHPANLWKRAREGVTGEYSEARLIHEQLGAVPAHVKLLAPDTDIDTLSLFEFADYGVTVRGTSGMELPCFGKPLLTAGTGRYSGLGFTVDSESAAEYLGRLAALHEMPPMTARQTELARCHAYAAFVLRPWRMLSFKSEFNYLKQGVHPLDHNLRSMARSLAEAEANGDLARFAAWAASGEVDYLEDSGTDGE